MDSSSIADSFIGQRQLVGVDGKFEDGQIGGLRLGCRVEERSEGSRFTRASYAAASMAAPSARIFSGTRRNSRTKPNQERTCNV